MKKFLLFFLLSLLTIKIYSQQFSQYNTGTLYDSFENPSQKAFIPDSSKEFAFNFFFPNINGNFFLSGDAQATLKTRYFLDMYNNAALQLGQGKFNHLNGDANAYLVMAKLFLSFKGDEEIGFSIQTRAEGKGIITDESIAALNGTQSFNNGTAYLNAFNDNVYYQTYNQISFTYKEKIDDQFTFGMKWSALMGTAYSNLKITNSNGYFNTNTQAAALALTGQYKIAYSPDQSTASYFTPNFRNPGVAVSIGTTYLTEDGFVIQGNIKDLGYIHWSNLSKIYNFNSSGAIGGLGTQTREDSVYHLLNTITHNNPVQTSFVSPTDGRAELSASKIFWIDENIKYSPTLIASKELFYPGFVAALVNPFYYKNYSVTLTTTYDDLRTFNLGGQFMVKTPNFEFFVGSDKLTQSLSLLSDVIKKPTQFNQNPAFTGGSFFIGFSFKIGYLIEHPMNASFVPGGFNNKGFFANLFSKIFKKESNDDKNSW